MLNRYSTKSMALLILLLSAGLTAASFYFDYVMQLEPCPLCILQRLAVIMITIVALTLFTHNPRGWGKRIYVGLLCLVSASGLLFAIRQVWLQNLPAEALTKMACAPGIDYMLAHMPLSEIIQTLLTAHGECGEVNWVFLNLSMAGWMVLWFSVLFCLSLNLNLRRN